MFRTKTIIWSRLFFLTMYFLFLFVECSHVLSWVHRATPLLQLLSFCVSAAGCAWSMWSLDLAAPQQVSINKCWLMSEFAGIRSLLLAVTAGTAAATGTYSGNSHTIHIHSKDTMIHGMSYIRTVRLALAKQGKAQVRVDGLCHMHSHTVV